MTFLGSAGITNALVGATQMGKSSFIKAMTGENVPIGNRIKSCTMEQKLYLKNGVGFLDTRGIYDTTQQVSNTSIMRGLMEEVLLQGRFQGFLVFQSLAGLGFHYEKVLSFLETCLGPKYKDMTLIVITSCAQPGLQETLEAFKGVLLEQKLRYVEWDSYSPLPDQETKFNAAASLLDCSSMASLLTQFNRKVETEAQRLREKAIYNSPIEKSSSHSGTKQQIWRWQEESSGTLADAILSAGVRAIATIDTTKYKHIPIPYPEGAIDRHCTVSITLVGEDCREEWHSYVVYPNQVEIKSTMRSAECRIGYAYVSYDIQLNYSWTIKTYEDNWIYPQDLHYFKKLVYNNLKHETLNQIVKS